MGGVRLRKVGKALVWLLLVGIVLITVLVLWIEGTCRGGAAAVTAPASASRIEPGDRRPEVNSYLSYPEWYIVHAYEDFVGVLKQHDEHVFGYLASIRGFWSSYCRLNRLVSGHGTTPLDTKVMLYTIGVSFTGEMALKGLYEITIGYLTAAIRGDERTAEDRFALAVAQDYARFLRQTPWYAYPFGTTLVRFWRETPLASGSIVRTIERRFALSAEFTIKAVYAKLIALLAGLSPAELRNRSVVRSVDLAVTTADPRVTLVRRLTAQDAIIETPRYRAFTDIVVALARRGDDMVEIAGNTNVLVTVLAPAAYRMTQQGVHELFAIPLQSRPGWRRLGLDVKVTDLSPLIRQLASGNAEFEHVYDY